MSDALVSGSGALQSAVRRLARRGAVPARVTAVGPIGVLAVPRLDALTESVTMVADGALEIALAALPGEPPPAEPAAAPAAGVRTRGRDDVVPRSGGQGGTRLRRAPASVAAPSGRAPNGSRPPAGSILSAAAAEGRPGTGGLEGLGGRADGEGGARPASTARASVGADDAPAVAPSLPLLLPAARLGAATPVRRAGAARVVPTGRPVGTSVPDEAAAVVRPAASRSSSTAAPTAVPRSSQALVRTASDTARAATAGPGGGEAERRTQDAAPLAPGGDGSGGLADLVRWWNDDSGATAEARPAAMATAVRSGDDAPRGVVVARTTARVERADPLPAADTSSPAARASLRDALEEILLAEARASGIEVRT